ncbi:MAG: hypothetical protein SynsKO_26410 [Synoicihabitans sp.]
MNFGFNTTTSITIPTLPFMKTTSFLVLATGLLLGAGSLYADSQSSTATFSNPDEPGRFKARLMHGEVSIRGDDVAEVTVSTDAPRNAKEKPREDGMRVISSGASFSLREKNNVMTLDYGHSGSWADHSQFVITVPYHTHLDIEVSMGGEVSVSEIAGDISIKNLNGEIELRDISGGAIVESMNGEIEASFLEVHEDRPLSFTSMNGEIALHLPVETAANVRFRTQNGTILTNFGEDVLVTTTTSGRTFAPEAGEQFAEFAAEMAEGAVEMALEIAEEVRDAMQEARIEIQAQREAEQAMQEAEDEMREAEREMRDAEREVRDMERAKRDAKSEARAARYEAPRAPRAPRPPSIPSMAGGKVISGTLNGGGVDLQVATMNGDIVIKKRTD